MYTWLTHLRQGYLIKIKISNDIIINIIILIMRFDINFINIINIRATGSIQGESKPYRIPLQSSTC